MIDRVAQSEPLLGINAQRQGRRSEDHLALRGTFGTLPPGGRENAGPPEGRPACVWAFALRWIAKGGEGWQQA